MSLNRFPRPTATATARRSPGARPPPPPPPGRPLAPLTHRAPLVPGRRHAPGAEHGEAGLHEEDEDAAIDDPVGIGGRLNRADLFSDDRELVVSENHGEKKAELIFNREIARLLTETVE